MLQGRGSDEHDSPPLTFLFNRYTQQKNEHQSLNKLSILKLGKSGYSSIHKSKWKFEFSYRSTKYFKASTSWKDKCHHRSCTVPSVCWGGGGGVVLSRPDRVAAASNALGSRTHSDPGSSPVGISVFFINYRNRPTQSVERSRTRTASPKRGRCLSRSSRSRGARREMKHFHLSGTIRGQTPRTLSSNGWSLV